MIIQASLEPSSQNLYRVHICGLCHFEIYAGEDCYDTPLSYICRECLSAYLLSIKEVAQHAEH